MAGPIGDMVEVVFGPAHQPQNRLHHLEIVLLPIGADQIGLASHTTLDDAEHGRAVVFGMDPVAHIEALAVQARPDPIDQIGDLAGDELLHVLVGAVVVGAVAQGRVHTEGAHPGAHQQVRAGLGR